MACLVWRICVFDSSFSRFSSKVTGATKRRSEKIEAFDMILVFLHKLEKKQKQIGSYGVWQSSATIQTSHQSCTAIGQTGFFPCSGKSVPSSKDSLIT
jgi:hypothetical protein